MIQNESEKPTLPIRYKVFVLYSTRYTIRKTTM